MKSAGLFLLVGSLVASLLLTLPARAKDRALGARDLMLDRVSGGAQQSAAQRNANRERLLTFKSSDEFPVMILDAITAHFKKQQLAPTLLAKQATIQMGSKGRIYSYLRRFAGSEKEYSFLFATLYKDASREELVYKAFFCADQAQLEDLRAQGEKILKDTLAYDTPRFSFYQGYDRSQ